MTDPSGTRPKPNRRNFLNLAGVAGVLAAAPVRAEPPADRSGPQPGVGRAVNPAGGQTGGTISISAPGSGGRVSQDGFTALGTFADCTMGHAYVDGSNHSASSFSVSGSNWQASFDGPLPTGQHQLVVTDTSGATTTSEPIQIVPSS